MRLPTLCMSAELWQIRVRGVHPTYLFPEERNQTYLLPPHVTLCTSHLISTLFCVQHLGNILSMIHIFLTTRIRAAFYRNRMVWTGSILHSKCKMISLCYEHRGLFRIHNNASTASFIFFKTCLCQETCRRWPISIKLLIAHGRCCVMLQSGQTQREKHNRRDQKSSAASQQFFFLLCEHLFLPCVDAFGCTLIVHLHFCLSKESLTASWGGLRR